MHYVKPHFKKILHIVGGGLGAAGVLFVAVRLHQYAGQIAADRFSPVEWFFIALLAFINGGANVLLAMAWLKTLAFLQLPAERNWAVNAYGLSQLAKYVPGNIFQFAGRQAIGLAAGLAAGPLLRSTAYELGMLAAAGAFFGILALPLWTALVPEWAAFLVFCACIAAIAQVLRRHVSRHLAAAWGFQLLFLALSGLVFWLILTMVSGHGPLPLASICGAYVLSWLLGLATPGAPAGVGVREAALLFMLGTSVQPSHLLIAVVMGRIVTVCGDLLFFCACVQRKRHLR
ncbi:hypothetical protein [Acidovorax sp. M2(2025)]|uniref:hypothetical protein n=1 Tax=Acidovorax sp. M2(2025) TaxID=3411355 RepID=UPI003BF5CD83